MRDQITNGKTGKKEGELLLILDQSKLQMARMSWLNRNAPEYWMYHTNEYVEDNTGSKSIPFVPKVSNVAEQKPKFVEFKFGTLPQLTYARKDTRDFVDHTYLYKYNIALNKFLGPKSSTNHVASVYSYIHRLDQLLHILPGMEITID